METYVSPTASPVFNDGSASEAVTPTVELSYPAKSVPPPPIS